MLNLLLHHSHQPLQRSNTQLRTVSFFQILMSLPSKKRLFKIRFSSALVESSSNVQVCFSPRLSPTFTNIFLEPKNAHESCVITSLPAKYRDPDTGLPFHDAYAYKEIQKLKRGEYKWSKLLGVYVGMGTYVARGVPERFREALPKPKISSTKQSTPAPLSDGK